MFSLDDKPLPMHPHSNAEEPGPLSRSMSVLTSDTSSPSFSQSRSTDPSPATPDSLRKTLKTPSISSVQKSETPSEIGSTPGFRAAEAFVRPSPIATVGNLLSYGFDLRNAVFTMSLECENNSTEATPTEVFLPDFHFPQNETEVQVSSGKWTISTDGPEGGTVQRLCWLHGVGEQNIKITGVKRRQGLALGKGEEEGYLEQCRQSNCSIM